MSDRLPPAEEFSSISTLPPICVLCVHFRRDVRPGLTCDAFPDFAAGGIPDAILGTRHDHHQPFPGDRGIHFHPLDEQAREDADMILRVARRAGILRGTADG